MRFDKYKSVAILAAFLIVFQVIASLVNRDYYLTQFTMSAYYVLVIIGLSVLMGYAGQISIGHAGFFAMGGYCTAVLTTRNLAHLSGEPVMVFLSKVGLTTIDRDPYGIDVLHISPWAALVAAIIITAVLAFVIGIPILKLKGHYLAMATLGFGSIIYSIVLGSRIFGEADGISDVPPFRLFGGLQVVGGSEHRVMNYYLAWFIVVAGLILLINLINSRVGRALRSIHGSEEAAKAMGVNTSRYKLMVFVLSAVFAAIGGVFMTHYNGGIGPSEAGVMKSVRYLAIVAVGGMANLWGALAMGIILNYLSLRGYFGSYDDAVFGIILIAIMLFAPDGILKRENLKYAGEFLSRIRKYFLRKKNETA